MESSGRGRDRLLFVAPRPPIRPQDVVRAIRSPDVQLPWKFGAPSVEFAVCRAGEAWQVRRLVLDPTLVQERVARKIPLLCGQGEEVLSPGPEILLEAPSLDDFCAALEVMKPWPPVSFHSLK